MKRILCLLGLLPVFASAEPVTAVREGTQLVVRCGEREILRYQAEAGELPREGIDPLYRRGGYIASIHSPSGRLVTDDFPPDHLHHHGVWTPWTKTRFEGRTPDFWNMGQGKGRVDFVRLGKVSDEGGRVSFEAEHRFVDMTTSPEKVALHETWKVGVAADEGRYLIDLELRQTCATDAPLELPEYHYGGFGFRGNRAWNGAANCRFLTASGKTDRVEVNTSREPWCWVGGEVDGRTTGVAILGAATNFRAPQPIRAHPTEPFFCYAPQQAGPMVIEPGKPYAARYRIIVFDGEPDPERLAKWAQEFAKADE